MATAVLSAGEAMHYAHGLWHGLDVDVATIVLLTAFMVLTSGAGRRPPDHLTGDAPRLNRAGSAGTP